MGVAWTHFARYLEAVAARTSEALRERFHQREKQVSNRLHASAGRSGRILDPQLYAIPAGWPAREAGSLLLRDGMLSVARPAYVYS